jgi:hypothetical protein
MPADVSFQAETVIVQGDVLDVQTYDVTLDHPVRRSRPTGVRRALVHDYSDGLTLNWDEDYPGGVTIKGGTTLDGVVISGIIDARPLATNLREPALVTRGRVIVGIDPRDLGPATGPARAIIAEYWPTLTESPGVAMIVVPFHELVRRFAEAVSEVRSLRDRVDRLERE